MWTRIKSSLPLQLVLMAVLAYILASFFKSQGGITWQGGYQLLMMGKVVYIGLLKMVIGLVVMLSLLQGIASMASITRLQSLGKNTLLFYGLTTTIAIGLGLGAALLMPQWEPLADRGVALPDNVTLISADAAQGSNVVAKLFNIALTNPFAALAGGNLLAIVTFSILLGIALLVTLPEKHPIYTLISDANQVVSRLVHWIVRLAPLAVFSIVLDFTLKGGQSLFSQLLMFSLLVFALTLVHGALILPLIARLATGISPVRLLKTISAPLAMAFTTSSSMATLPVSLETAEEKLGVSQSTSSMVLPLGAVMNMDGTALFEGVAAVFLAQLFGIDLGTFGIVMIFIMAMVSSVGAPGMPSGSMSGMQMVMLAAGIPLEAIAILLLVERPLDTFRTAVNVEGDLVAALVVDHWERERIAADTGEAVSAQPLA